MKVNHSHRDNIQKPKSITHCSPPEENLQEARDCSSDGQCAPVPYKISEQWQQHERKNPEVPQGSSDHVTVTLAYILNKQDVHG